MMNNSALKELDVKVSLLLEKYIELKEENARLKEVINSSKEIEAKLHQEILKLKEDDEMKDLEIEDITLRVSKLIESNENGIEKISMAS